MQMLKVSEPSDTARLLSVFSDIRLKQWPIVFDVVAVILPDNFCIQGTSFQKNSYVFEEAQNATLGHSYLQHILPVSPRDNLSESFHFFRFPAARQCTERLSLGDTGRISCK